MPWIPTEEEIALLKFLLHAHSCERCISFVAPLERRSELERIAEWTRLGLSTPAVFGPKSAWRCDTGILLARATEAERK